jgi:hypothetical protein
VPRTGDDGSGDQGDAEEGDEGVGDVAAGGALGRKSTAPSRPKGGVDAWEDRG